MKNITGNKGFTMIEIIIALAIFSILATAFASALNTGFIGIVKSGQRADAAYQAQQAMTDKLIQNNDFIGEQEITFDFDGGPSIVVDVNILESEVDVNGNISNMKSFVTKP